jgi:hypothetical protein
MIEGVDPLEELTTLQQQVYASLPNQFRKKDGVIVAMKGEMSERTFSRFLKKRAIFRHEKHGSYLKKI